MGNDCKTQLAVLEILLLRHKARKTRQ